MTVPNLKKLCKEAVVELKFVRRVKKMGFPMQRRMFCTLNVPLLNGDIGQNILNFKRPTKPPPYNAEAKGLVVVWDIIMQDWRNIDAKSAVVIKKTSEDSLPIYVNDQEGIQKFALFFNAKIRRMNARQFMDS